METKDMLIIGIVVLILMAGSLYYLSKRTPTDSGLSVEELERSAGSTQSNPNNTQINEDELDLEDSRSSNMPTTQNQKQYPSAPANTLEQGKDFSAVLNTTKGDIKIDLFENQTPITVNNFVFLARENFYNNVKFHRIMKGFMIQTGDPTGTGSGGPGYRFNDEPFDGEYEPGVVAMANAGPNTNGSQFFIMHGNTQLPKNYVIFGKVADAESMAIVDAIANTPVTAGPSGEPSTPTENILINSVIVNAN